MKKGSADRNIEFAYLEDKFAHSINDINRRSISITNGDELLRRGFQGTNSYQGSKWMNYFRAPDIYWRILDNSENLLVRIEEMGRLTRGITSGADEFFYLTDEEIQHWGVEDEYLVPFMKSAIE